MIYLIDYENVHGTGLEGLDNLTEDDKLIIFLREQDTFGARLHVRLEQSKVQREYIFITATTKNALDFELVAYLSLQCAKNPDSEFSIISKDQGYDAAVTLLKKEGFKVIRKNNIKTKEDILLIEQKPKVIELPAPKEKEEDNKQIVPKNNKRQQKTTIVDNEVKIEEIKELLPDFSEKDQEKITNIINGYKTKQTINNHMTKTFNHEQVKKIYKKIKPLLKNKS